MVSVTMSADPPFDVPDYNPHSGIVYLKGIAQIHAYYEKNFRIGQMETFARMVLEKGYGACTPHGRKNEHGVIVRETWQACGRRLFGERFVEIMDRVVTEYRAEHASAAPAPAVVDLQPPAHILEGIPDPDF